jgi:hypothetical protein
MTEHGSFIDISAWHHLCMKFVIANFPVIPSCNCSDIPSHIHIGISIIGRLKTVFILALKTSFLISLSAVLLFFTFDIPPFRCVRYIITGGQVLKLGCSSVIAIRWRVHWVKGLRVKLDFNDQSRKYNFLLFPLDIN